MNCVEERFDTRGKSNEREQRTREKVLVGVYRKQKERRSMMNTRDDESF